MKILYLTQGHELYGSQRQLAHLINAIDKEKFKPFVAHSERMNKSDFPVHDDITQALIEMRAWRKLRNLFGRYFDAYKLLRFAEINGIDLIHCSYQWLFPYAKFVGEKLEIPVLLHIRRPGTDRRKALSLEYFKAAAIIAISKRIESELAEIKELKNIVSCIHDAVDHEFFEEDRSESLKIEFGIEGKLSCGLIGRVYKTKRQMEFVEAAHELIKNGVDAYFFIVGRVDSEAYFGVIQNYVVSHDLSHRIFFTGHRRDMPEVMKSIDVLVTLSGGSVMYEAMAAGKVVISAGFTQPQHSVHVKDGSTGLVTGSKEHARLVAFMMQAASDSGLRKTIGENSRNWALSHFSCEKQAAQVQDIYLRVLGRTGNNDRAANAPGSR